MKWNHATEQRVVHPPNFYRKNMHKIYIEEQIYQVEIRRNKDVKRTDADIYIKGRYKQGSG
jgi:hypothetical protein